MKSWICEQQGLEHVVLKDQPCPKLDQPDDDYKVIIKLIAASVNPVDFKRCSMDHLGFPARLGSDILGQVIEIGPKVDKEKYIPQKTHVLCLQNLGEKSSSGAFSEYTKQDSRYISIVPPELLQTKYNRFQLACLPVAAYTAYQIVVQKLKIELDSPQEMKKPCKNIVVTAGSGGVGSYTLQMLAQWRKLMKDQTDIKIIATCSKKNEQYVKSIGATHFVDYTANIEEQLKQIIGIEKGVDIWIDMVGYDSLKLGMQNLRFSGEAVTILGAGNEVQGGQFFANQATLHGVALGWVYMTKQEELCKELKKIGDKCIDLYQRGILKANIDRIYPFQKVDQALQFQKEGHVRGKLVIDFDCKHFLSQIPSAPPDSILGLSVAFKQCTDAKKVNLGVGAYRDDDGKPVVLSSIKQAEKIIFDKNMDNEYQQPHGHEQFIQAALELAYSKDSKPLKENRILGFQTLSGTGGLFVAFEFLKKFQQDITVYLPAPTWPNHNGILDQLEIKKKTYRYFNPQTNGLDFPGMLSDLHQIPAFSVVLLHACSHNPTGIDPTKEQWLEIKQICEQKQFIVLFDMAYQGFTSGSVDTDAWTLRQFSESNLVLLCVQSFAKNMGLYGQRIGCLSVICSSPEEKQDILSQMKIISRRVYSNPPLHGARIVAEVLTNPEIYQLWLKEVKSMAERIISMRELFVKYIKEAGSKINWDHIINQKGMFAYTGINSEQVKKLKEECFIFMTNNGRISIAGLNTKNCKYVAECFHKVTQ